MRLNPKLLALALATAALGGIGLAVAPGASPPPSFSASPAPFFELAAGSDPLLFKVSDGAPARAPTPLGNRPSFGDVVESSIPSVVQVRVQKRGSPDEASEDEGEGDGSLLDFLKRYGLPSPAKPPQKTPPFGASPPDLLGEDPLGLRDKPPARPSVPFPKPPAKPPLSGGVGSGFFIDESGHLLTNAHVVEGAQKIILLLSDHREIEARLIGIDKRTDIALLKADGERFKPLPLGSPDKSRVGDWVLAIGSPFGLDFTATAGILSAKGRALPSDDNYIPFLQTDAAVNPGNSGGPLINERGQAIGINSQIYSKSGGYMGISFAIPIDYAIKIAAKMRKGDGTIAHGRIGATVQDMTRDLAQAFGLSGQRGAIILSIEPGSASDKAGLQSSDIVLTVQDKPISGSNEMVRLIADSDPGDKLVLGIVRKNQPLTVPVVLGGPKPAPPEAPSKGAAPAKPSPSALREPLGIKGRGLTDKESQALGVPRGIKIFETSGASETAGVEPDDILLSADQQAVGSIDELAKAIERAPAGRPIALLLRREAAVRYVAVHPAAR